MVCAPHVETSAGIILNKEYCKAIGDACKEVGATFCLDGVASGTAWVDMDYANIGAYITAPQKGWSGPAAVGGHMYHATMPTDAIKVFRDVVHETEKFGLKEAE